MKHIDVFYVLREVGTAKYMPQLDGRGYTSVQFRELCIPRLFTSARAAKTALTWWQKGPITVYRGHVDFGDDDSGEEWHMPTAAEARTNDIEVVEVWLQEKTA